MGEVWPSFHPLPWISLSRTGKTLDGGGSHLNLDKIWRFDLDDLEASSGALALTAASKTEPGGPWGLNIHGVGIDRIRGTIRYLDLVLDPECGLSGSSRVTLTLTIVS